MTQEKKPKPVSKKIYEEIKKDALSKMTPEQKEELEKMQKRVKNSREQDTNLNKLRKESKDRKTVSWVVDNMMSNLRKQSQKIEDKKKPKDHKKALVEIETWTEEDEKKREELIAEIANIQKEIEELSKKIKEMEEKEEETPAPVVETTTDNNSVSNEEQETIKQDPEVLIKETENEKVNTDTEQEKTEGNEQKKEYSFEEIFEEIKKDILKQDGVKEIGNFEIEYIDNQIKISGYLKINLYVNRKEGVHRMDIRNLTLERTDSKLSVIKRDISTGFADSLRQNEKVQAVLNILENLDKEIVKHAKEKEIEKININGTDLNFL